MLALSSSARYFMYKEPTDMRFGINSLSGLVRNKLGFDPDERGCFCVHRQAFRPDPYASMG
jgi:transposase